MLGMKIGVLGGGQLSRMLALKSHEMGNPLFVLSPSQDDPAAQVTKNWVQGNIDCKNDVVNFCRKVDFLTFESEFVSPNILKILNKMKTLKVYPNPETMMELQDRLTQKNLLEKYLVPTSPFQSIQNYQELQEIKETRKLPLVLKARRNGYDGKGTYILKKWDDPKVKTFFKGQEFGLIAEDFIPFKREVAVSFSRSPKGDVIDFPLVEIHQQNYRCLWAKGPINHDRFSGLKSKLKKFIKAIDYVGLISFEIFDTGDQLIINEIAPRVHNSAHYSLNGTTEDQFSSHLRAIHQFEITQTKSYRRRLCHV